jgi:hypothetical protein
MESMMLSLSQEGGRLHDAQQAFFSAGAGVFAFGFGAALIVSLLGILYMTLVVSPNLTQRCSTALRERNFLSFLAGVPVTGVALLLAAVLHKAPALLAILATGFGVTLILAYAAASEDIGRRLFWACGKEGSRSTHLAAGWLIFAFGALFPVIGWFVILPYVSLSGLGSLVVGTFSSRKPEASAAAASPKEIEFPKE